MSTYKTKVESGTLDRFLQEHNISGLEAIADGEVSQAYLFESAGKQKVLRVNAHTKEGFQKDQLAYRHFASSEVPIPKIDEIGQLPDGYFYAISDRFLGKTLDKLTGDELRATLPSIIQTMEAIHQTVPVGDGFGWIKLDSNGKYDSWHAALDGSQAGEDDDTLDTIDFFERDVYDRARAKIQEYYRFVPKNIRQLVHTDYGFSNVLAEDGRVTGVIDWDGVAYGDPLYDVAWLEFWAPAFNWPKEVDTAGAIRRHYIDKGQLPKHYDERIGCYKMIISANCMSFFAKSGQKDKYDYVRDELAKIKVSS